MDRNNVIRPAIDVFLVALRKESVDRNIQTLMLHMAHLMSLSARRAWIEMLVSRLADMSAACRSPQGERG